MAVSIPLEVIKGKAFLSITDNKQDTEIQGYIDSVIISAIDYLDDEDITKASEIPSALEFPLMKQINYEYRRKADPGLSSVSYPDGSVSKFSVSTWLSSVKRILDRHKHIEIG